MAPERFRGEGDARADIYALGLTLYELLTLQPAFETSDRLKLIERVKTEEPPRPRSLDGRIPRDLETIVLKAIEKDPEQRGTRRPTRWPRTCGGSSTTSRSRRRRHDGRAIRPLGAAQPGDRGAGRGALGGAGLDDARLAHRRTEYGPPG